MKRAAWLALLLVLAAPVSAQEAPVAGFGALSGVVVDSVRGGPLRGAAVRVEGTQRFAFTDSLGRYLVAGVPEGRYAVELFHELLDTLGVRVYTPPVEFTAGVTVTLDLGVPSPATIIRAKCRASASDAGAVFGVVLDADREEPVADAEVLLAWTELTVDRDGIKYRPQQRTATTDASGRFRLCYLPVDLSADISAALGSDSTSAVLVTYDQFAFGMATIFLDTPNARSDTAAALPRGASLRGVVVDSSGKPVPGARVGFASSRNAAITDSAGTFALDGQRPGTQALVVRRLGYAPAEVIVNLTRRAPRDVTVRMDAFVPVLDAVLVEARRMRSLDRIGFTGRARSGAGRYLTQADLDRRNAMRISDFLTMMPGLRRSGAFGESCIRYWVDGIKWQAHPDDFMTPSEVAAIEVYPPSFVPAEFHDFNSCAAVVIWTKWKLRTR